MGQGFSLINYTKREQVSPHDLGLGYKLGEFGTFDPRSDFRGSLTTLARELTAEGGQWYGDSVYFVGDYGDVLNLSGQYDARTIELDGEDGAEFPHISTQWVREWVRGKAEAHDLAGRVRFWEMMDRVDAQMSDIALSDSEGIR